MSFLTALRRWLDSFILCSASSAEENEPSTTEKSESAVIELSYRFIEVHKKVEDILLSGTNYADVLQQNIEVFHKAITTQVGSEKDLVGFVSHRGKTVENGSRHSLPILLDEN